MKYRQTGEPNKHTATNINMDNSHVFCGVFKLMRFLRSTWTSFRELFRNLIFMTFFISHSSLNSKSTLMTVSVAKNPFNFCWPFNCINCIRPQVIQMRSASNSVWPFNLPEYKCIDFFYVISFKMAIEMSVGIKEKPASNGKQRKK